MALSKIDDRGLNTPIDLLDNEKIRLGTGNDLEFVHNGTDSEIKGTTGSLTIKNANNLNLYTAVNEEAIVAVANGSVSLYHNANKKLETSSGGVTITGNAVASSKFRGNDDVKLSLGDGEDLQIYHDGSHSFIRDTGTGMLSIDGSQINLHNAAGSEYMLQAVENGAVSLYYDNSKKLETYNGGVEVFGDCSLGDDKVLNIGTGSDLQIKHDGSNSIINQTGTGTLRIQQDETNHWEFGDSFLKGNDNRKIILGDGSDLEIYHDGSNSIIKDAGTGSLKIITNQLLIREADGNANMLTCNENGAVELYYNDTKMFETVDYGAFIKRPSGGSTVLQIEGSEGNHATINMFADDGDNDNDKWQLDAQTGNSFILYNYAAGSWEKSFLATGSGAFNIYHNNNKVIETHSAGIKVGVVGNTQQIWFPDSNNDDEGIIEYNHSDDSMRFTVWGTQRFAIFSNSKVQTNLDFKPGSDDSLDIGASGARFDDVYATNGSIQTSDRNEKESITATDLGLEFINKLTPVSFKRKGKTRTHYGLIAQDVETVITDLGKNTTQFAPIIKEDISEKQDGSNIRYGLRYDELISPLVKAIQEQQAEIETLNTKVAALEAA